MFCLEYKDLGTQRALPKYLMGDCHVWSAVLERRAGTTEGELSFPGKAAMGAGKALSHLLGL